MTNTEAFHVICERCASYECHHPRHNPSPLVPAHSRIFTLASDKRSRVDAVTAPQPKRGKGVLKSRHLAFDVFALVVNDKAYQIKAG